LKANKGKGSDLSNLIKADTFVKQISERTLLKKRNGTMAGRSFENMQIMAEGSSPSLELHLIRYTHQPIRQL